MNNDLLKKPITEDTYDKLVNIAGQNNFGLTMTYFIAVYEDKDFWAKRQPCGLSLKKFNSFVEFAMYEVPWGLGFDIDVIKACCKRNPNIWNEYLDNLPEIGEHGGNRKKDYVGHQNGKNNKSGNNKEYLIQKLKKHSPEIADEVISGKISANQGMIKAGLRTEVITVKHNAKDISKKILANFERDEIKEIFNDLNRYLNEKEKFDVKKRENSYVKFTESKLPLDVTIKYFIEFYHNGFYNVEDAKKYYFEMIEQNGFDNISNKESRKLSYKEFIETPILEGGLGSNIDDFEKLFVFDFDVLDKHKELLSNK
jgi:hypothetical protein